MTEPYRAGMITLLGRPNVGKSTLVNRLLGRKISITSRKPQTTRHRILGIKTTPRAQFVYIDTPGIHSAARRALNRYLNRTALHALEGVDLCLLVVEALRWTGEDSRVLERLAEYRSPCLLVINKVDRVADKTRLLPFLEAVHGRAPFRETVPVSARKGLNLERLEEVIYRLLPESGHLFPAEQWTDRDEPFVAAELIREQLVRLLADELPHRLSVQIERFSREGATLDIGALIWVERPGQKAIVIGSGGRTLKSAGTRARAAIEQLFGCHVRLELWVKVRPGWSDDDQALRRFGYL